MIFRILYSIFIILFEILLWCLAPFRIKIRKMMLGRSQTLDQIKGFRAATPDAEVIWFHAASVGEFEQALPVIRLFKQQRPDWKIAVSFFSPSGFDLKANHPLLDLSFYLPSDKLWVQVKLMRYLKPRILVLVKYEFWHNLIFAANRFSIPVYSICCILKPATVGHFLYGILIRKTLPLISHFFVQNIETAQILRNMGLQSITLNGDTRVDRVLEIKEQTVDFTWIETWKAGHKLLIVGSAWLEDIIFIKSFLQNAVVEAHGLWRVLIVPHEIDEHNLSHLTHALQLPNELFSKWETHPDETDILILDKTGMLSRLYRYADAAWIGGGFKTGLHNTLEAAVYGIPIGIGPNYKKYQEAIDLHEIGVVRSFPEGGSIWEFFQESTEIDTEKDRISQSAHLYFNRQKGASKSIVDLLIGHVTDLN